VPVSQQYLAFAQDKIASGRLQQEIQGGLQVFSVRTEPVLRMLPKLALFAFAVAFLTGGCAGPHALRHSRQKYAEVVQVTQNEQLLLNLVRLRYRDTPSFLELSNLASQFNFDESVGVAGTLKENSKNFNVLGLSAGVAASERPTASYSPLQGAAFVTKLVTPIEEETIVLLTRSGWKGERVFRIAVQSLNGLSNLRKASGPTPEVLRQVEIEDANLFQQVVRNLEEYSESRIVRFNYETVEVPKSAAIPGSLLTAADAVDAAQNGLKIVYQHEQVSIPIGRIKSDSEKVEDYLQPELLGNLIEKLRSEGLARPIRVKHDSDAARAKLGPNDRPFTVVGDDLTFIAAETIHGESEGRQFKLLSCDLVDPNNVIITGTTQKLVMTWDARKNEDVMKLGLPNLETPEEGRYVLQLEPRSLIGAMFYLSHAINVPLEHQMAGLVVCTTDEFGVPFDWVGLTGDLLCVHSSKQKPECAAVAVKYRGHWFYIDDRDHSSKATFALLTQLFELQAGGGAGKGPVLTLPVGI
jgi:hypothetical protein